MNEDEAFAEIVEELGEEMSKYLSMNLSQTPIVDNCSVSAGEMTSNHEDNCDCDKRILLINLTFTNGYPPVPLVVRLDSPFGHALLSGELQAVCKQRLEELS